MAEKTLVQTDNENKPVQREVTRNPETYSAPLTDIYEEEDGLHMLVDMPGVVSDGLKLNVEKNILTIEGYCADEESKNYIMREFEPTSYFRQFELSESVDQENIKAEMKNGVLSLFLPRAEELKPKVIKVVVN